MTLRNLFLPVGLLLALAFGLLWPEPGAAFRDAGAVPWLVVIIFLLNGYEIRLDQLADWRGLLRLLLPALPLSLAVGPLLGWLTARALGLDETLALGLLVMSAMPSTLSSAVVLTTNAGGRTDRALALTVLGNLVGILTVPLALGWLSGSDADIDGGSLFWKLVRLVLVPLVIGQAIRQLAKARKLPAWAQLVPSACVILTVWATVAASNGTVRELAALALAQVLTASLLVHGALLGLCAGAGMLLRLPADERPALLFTGAQKTLPVAVTVLTALQASGAAVVVCVVFHLLQLVLDSVLAARMRPRTQ